MDTIRPWGGLPLPPELRNFVQPFDGTQREIGRRNRRRAARIFAAIYREMFTEHSEHLRRHENDDSYVYQLPMTTPGGLSLNLVQSNVDNHIRVNEPGPNGASVKLKYLDFLGDIARHDNPAPVAPPPRDPNVISLVHYNRDDLEAYIASADTHRRLALDYQPVDVAEMQGLHELAQRSQPLPRR
jgi:hypothetical protein